MQTRDGFVGSHLGVPEVLISAQNPVLQETLDQFVADDCHARYGFLLVNGRIAVATDAYVVCPTTPFFPYITSNPY